MAPSKPWFPVWAPRRGPGAYGPGVGRRGSEDSVQGSVSSAAGGSQNGLAELRAGDMSVVAHPAALGDWGRHNTPQGGVPDRQGQRGEVRPLPEPESQGGRLTLNPGCGSWDGATPLHLRGASSRGPLPVRSSLPAQIHCHQWLRLRPPQCSTVHPPVPSTLPAPADAHHSPQPVVLPARHLLTALIYLPEHSSAHTQEDSHCLPRNSFPAHICASA